MLTIAAVPKPFLGHIKIIQRNAIQSWLKLKPECEIILFGDDEGVAETAKEFGVLHIPKIKKEFGVPLLNDVFNLTKKIAKHQLIAYVTADDILMSDFIKGISLVKFPLFILAGVRCELDIKEPVQFNQPDWEEKLHQRAVREGKIYRKGGTDYFVFPRNLELNLPDFVVGRPGYDNSILYKARFFSVPVIDATQVIRVIHQNHKSIYHSKGPEAKRNIELAGGLTKLLTLRDADWVLTPEGSRRPKFPRIILSKLSLFYPWRLLLAVKRRFR